MTQTFAKVLLCGALFTAALAGATFAQGAFLSGDATRNVMFDMEMRGEVAGMRFVECINGQGETFYRVQGRPADAGLVSVTDEGLICYAYSSTNYEQPACWRLRRNGATYELVSEAGDLEVPVTIRPRRAAACFADRDPFGGR